MSRGTDRRTVRIAPELWERAGRVAVSNDETLSDVMRRALEGYTKESGQLMSESPEPYARLLVELTGKTHDALNLLSEYEELNKTTIVNRAVQVYELISNLQRTGGSVVFADSLGDPVKLELT